MTRRRSNAKQKAAHDAARRAGRILDPHVVADIADALKLADKGSLTAAERVRLSSARLTVQAHPLAFRQTEPEPWPTAPTKEQQAKHKFEKRAEAGGVYSHRVKSAFESLSKHYPDAVLLALTRFYTDAESHSKLHPRIANLNANGGSGFGSQIGNLSRAEERIRDQYERHKRITGILRSIDEEHLDVLRWLVLEVRKFDQERMPDITEVGRRLVPTIIDRATSRGISIGYLKAVAQLLIRLYRNDRLEHGDEYRRNYDEFDEAEA